MHGYWKEVHMLVLPTLAAVVVCLMMLGNTQPKLEESNKYYNQKRLDFYFCKISEGENLFKANCNVCHKLSAIQEGIDLKTVRVRMPDTLIESFLWYPERTAVENGYVHALYNDINWLRHPSFLHTLSEQDIQNIILYIACYDLKKN